MAQQHFCFKWNNYQANMSEVFQNMLLNENMVDCTIACEGASLKAHKMVLSACSPFFQSLFMSNPCKHPIVIIKDTRFADLKATIDFIYKGEVNVSQDQLAGLLKTAETLRVKGLSDITEKQARGQSNKKKRKRRRTSSKPGSPGSKDEGMVDTGCGDDFSFVGADGSSSSESESEAGHFDEEDLNGDNHVIKEEDDKLMSLDNSMETSKILEQSLATAEVSDPTENGGDVVIASDVHVLTDDETMKQVSLFQDSIDMPQGPNIPMITFPGTSAFSPSTQSRTQSNRKSDSSEYRMDGSQRQVARRLMMSESQRSVLKGFLDKPISCFDVDTDDAKKSIVWSYFGELVYRDPISGRVQIIDRDRHYCAKCIAECVERCGQEIFEKCNVCFLSNGTATGNHKNHLRLKHGIVDERGKRSSKVMIIELGEGMC